MRKTIAAASIAIGGFGVLGLGAAAIAGAQDDPSDDERGGWVQDALSGLVENGTITEEQADAVEEALDDTRPDRGFEEGIGHPGFAFGFGGISTVAESLGIGEDELRAALADGQTIADVAEEQGVDVQDVVDEIVAAQRERLDEAVAEGHLTQEEADEFLAGAEERVTAFVNGELPDPEDLRELPHFGDRGLDRGEDRPWANGPPWDDDSSEDGAA
jgi:polyhydroxyalkanoate synthesis regulator phasin